MNFKQKLGTAAAVIIICWAAVIVLKASVTVALTVTAVVLILRALDMFADIPLVDRVLDIEFSDTLEEAREKARKWLD